MILLNETWDFASVSLYGSLLVRAVTLSIWSNHSLNDYGSLALNLGKSWMNCKFSWSAEDLLMLCGASVVYWCKCLYYVLALIDASRDQLLTCWSHGGCDELVVQCYQFVCLCFLASICWMNVNMWSVWYDGVGCGLTWCLIWVICGICIIYIPNASSCIFCLG